MYGNKQELITAIWRERVIDANNSGLTKAEWCRQNNIKSKTFYKWQKIIQDEEIERINNDTGPDQSLTFVELPAVKDGHPGKPVQIPDSNLKFKPEIAINIGAQTVYVGKDVSEKTLATVVKVLTYA